ncbi:MAG: hypothetical protein HKP58_00060 [Desulfatitalea sp.]|nr:hypothetical protein [Desulfatitalea sp.]NNJ98782.1 hypothetical protein [Desulfatitalea sp.]
MKEKSKGKYVPRERDENGFWKIDKKTRLDIPAPDFSNVDYLSEEDKALGAKLVAARMPQADWGLGDSPKRENIWWQQPSFLLLCDPKSAEFFFEWFNSVVTAVTGLDGLSELYPVCLKKDGINSREKSNDPDVRRKLSNALLMGLAIGVEFDDQYCHRLYSLLPLDQREFIEGSDYVMDSEKIAMLRFPRSSVWSEEESLALQFTYAVMRRKMTDEIWDHAMASWGEKETIRNIHWIGLYTHLYMFQNAMDLRLGEW